MSRAQFDEEYQELKEFISFYAANYIDVGNLPPELHPVACLENFEARWPSRAKKGLKQAVDDVLEATLHWEYSRICELDAALQDRNIVTLSELRRRFAVTYSRILNRKEIRNETEYYLIKGILDGADLTDGDTELLGSMMAEFEARR